MNQRDAKFYIAVVAVALLLAVFSTALAMTGRTGPLRSAALTLTTPLRTASARIGDGLTRVGGYFHGIDALQKENDDLHAQIDELKRQLEAGQILAAENEQLRDLLGMKEGLDSLAGYDLLAARVVSYESADHISVLTLNRGTADGVKLNQTVMTPDGLLGRVSDVGRNWAKVSTVLNLNSRTGALIERTGVLGVIGGGSGTGVADPALKKQGFCLLSYLDVPLTDLPVQTVPVLPEAEELSTATDLPAASDPQGNATDTDVTPSDLPSEPEIPNPYAAYIAVGDRVVTSGVGYVFPAGILVGTVAEIRVNPYDRSLEAIVRPAVDFSIDARAEKLTEVVILVPTTKVPLPLDDGGVS